MGTYECRVMDKATNKMKNVGRMEIKNKTADRAELYLYGDIVSEAWESYYYDEAKCPQDISDFLAGLDGLKEIDIYVNSGGGSVHAGLAIYNQLKRHDGYKRAYIDGIGASISSVIPFACDEVNLYKCSQLMIHKPWGGCMGDADDFRKQAEALDSCQTAITNIYMDHVKEGVTREQITDLINAETWFTGEEAGEVFNVNIIETQAAQASASNYYNKYKKQPQNSQEEEKENKELEMLQARLDLLVM